MYKFTDKNIVKISQKQIKYRISTFSADSCSKIVAQLEGILNGNAGGYPHLLKLGEMPGLSDGHHQPLVVPAAGEEVEEADPKIPDIPPVLAPARPGLYHALV